MKNSFIISMLLLLLFVGCSKKGMTPTKVNLKVAGLTGLTGTIGAGGGILFGKSSQGEIFGHVIGLANETIEMPNGNWTFYAFVWESTTVSPVTPMNDAVYCGKSVQVLSGVDVSVNMNLTNANCTDPEFSNGRNYLDTSSGKNRFADFFLEECDELTALPGFTCGLNNQGSALSYRMVFKDFKKNPATGFNFDGPGIYSACQKVDKAISTDLLHKGLPVNFPSGNGSTPFVVSLELFLGNNTCTADGKGVHTVVLNQGIGTQNPVDDKIIPSSSLCSLQTGTFAGTPEEIKNKCEDYFGMMSGGTCSTGAIPEAISRFIPAALCISPSISTAANMAIKHLISIPKSFLCGRYLGQSSVIGAHPFAGGNGSKERPYKICTEWQINQIGEANAPAVYESSFYKLMNDLDMNKTDFMGPYSKPACMGITSSLIKDHHNLNSLDKIADDSTCLSVGSNAGFTGAFDGNGKTISNARIVAESVDNLGFVRYLHGGSVKNLIFKNLEVRGKSRVGGIAGLTAMGTYAPEIKNIIIDGLDVEGHSNGNIDGDNIGGIAGLFGGSTSNINNARVSHSHVRGRQNVGGLAGSNEGKIDKSYFSGAIDHHDSTGNNIGGLVGSQTNSAQILQSFSEGYISSSALNTGGVIGLNSGALNEVYSTMAILWRSSGSSGSPYIGGIVGNHSTGSSLHDVFFDGSIAYSGGGSAIIRGIIGTGSGTSSNCFTSNAATPGGSCTTVGHTGLRDGARSFTTMANWGQRPGSIPRFLWESRECLLPENQLSVDAQIASPYFRGTQVNPIIICTAFQLSSLSGRAAAEYYRLAEDINLGPWVSASLLTSFNGNLAGNQKILYGASITLATEIDENVGLIKTVTSTAKISNLKLAGNKILNTAGINDDATGLFAGRNEGVLKNITLIGNIVEGNYNVGQLTGVNMYIVSDINIEDGEVKGYQDVGGLSGGAGPASVISKAEVRSKISNFASDGYFHNFGGIIGSNYGSIDQARFGGSMDFALSAATEFHAGGIAGVNDGAITNTYTDNYSSITVKNTQMIGGLIGENTSSGSVNRSFALGKVIYNSGGITPVIAPASQPFHSLIGSDSGTVGGDIFFLENNIGSLLSSGTITSNCTGVGPYTCNVSTPSGNLFSLSYGGEGNGLNSLIPMSVASSTIQYNGSQSYLSATAINFYQSYTLGSTTGLRTIPQFSTLATFCSGWSGSTGNEVCSNGYDIVSDISPGVKYGENRLMAYYKAVMDGTAIPSNAPVWHLDEEGSPRLLQLDHH